MQRKAYKSKTDDTMRVRRMNALVTDQIMPKLSLETLVTIRKLKYFGHKIHSSDYMKILFILRLRDDMGK